MPLSLSTLHTIYYCFLPCYFDVRLFLCLLHRTIIISCLFFLLFFNCTVMYFLSIKNIPPAAGRDSRSLSDLCVSLGKAVTAVDGLILSGSERHLCLSAAFCTDAYIHLLGSTPCGLLCLSALGASLRLVFKALGSVEFLFAGGKYELITAVLTN